MRELPAYSVPQRKRGPKREDREERVIDIPVIPVSSSSTMTQHETDLRQRPCHRVRQMESILTSLLRGVRIIKPEPEVETAAADDSDGSDGDSDISHRAKRAKVAHTSPAGSDGGHLFSQCRTSASNVALSLSQPDMTHLINALNSSTSPDSMKSALDIINELEFDMQGMATALSKTSPVIQVKPEGFRGIALSLQRKMRRGILPVTEIGSPQDLFASPSNHISPVYSGIANQQLETVEDLASDTILFFGPTSTTTSSAWRQSPRFAGGIMNISLSFEANPTPSKLLDGDNTAPCSLELVLHLIGMYFKHIHPYFPMVHKSKFFQQFKGKRTDHFSLLLYSMCALVSQQCRNLTAWGISNPADLHMAFFDRARTLLGQQFDWPHINNVQALLLLSIVGQGTNINATSYHYIGIAHRLAVELGMHRNLNNLKHPSLDSELLESMRTTWFCLYVLDRYASVVEGRPMAISDDEWDTPFPATDSADLEFLKCHVGLCEILGRIANFVNRPNFPGPNRMTFPHLLSYVATPKDAKHAIQKIHADLTLWHSNLPEQLQQRPAKSSEWSTHHHLYCMSYTARVLLNRLDAEKFDERTSKYAVEVSRVLECLPAFDDDSIGSGMLQSDFFVFVVPLVVYSALASSTLFIDLAVASKSNNDGSLKRKAREFIQVNQFFSGKVTPEMSRLAGQQLRRSLISFDRLKHTSLFANYYGQLVLEVLRNEGIVLPTNDTDTDDYSPPPVDLPSDAAPQSIFSIFSHSASGDGLTEPSFLTSMASSSESFATRMKASLAEGVTNWNEYMHLSPKLRSSHMFAGGSSASATPASSAGPVGLAAFANLPQLPGLPNLPSLPNLSNLQNLPNPIAALREFGSGFWGYNPTGAGAADGSENSGSTVIGSGGGYVGGLQGLQQLLRPGAVNLHLGLFGGGGGGSRSAPETSSTAAPGPSTTSPLLADIFSDLLAQPEGGPYVADSEDIDAAEGDA
ncbi:hypothetical protein HDU83_004585 [Entophlyctis luteolus]|nr:hypothetical protein HDU83_004585 [Entophlyctis luteolus]